MALALNDILQITDVQTFLGQQMLNVYFYRVALLESLVGYDNIAITFEDIVVDEVINIQHTGVTHTRVIIKNLTNGLDIYEYPITTVGTATGDSLASFYAAAFRLIRETAATRHGAKRIGGIPEGHVNGNDIAAGVVATYNAVAAVLGGDFGLSGLSDEDFTLSPVIVGRYPKDDPLEGQLDLSNINNVQSAQFIRVTSQTTRRAGRGS